MSKFYRIGEISKLYHIGVDSIRYYEEIGLISPKRSESGYRIYSEEDIWRLNVIRDLRELGFDMHGIQKYMCFQNVETALEMLRKEQEAIGDKMRKLETLRANVEKRIRNIRVAQQLPLDEIVVKEVGDRNYYVLPKGYSNEYEMDILIKELANRADEHLYIIGNNQIGSAVDWKNADEEKPLRYRSVFAFDDGGDHTIPGGKYLSVSYRGAYDQSKTWIRRLIFYAEEHNLKMDESILELIWIDVHTSQEVEEHVTELQVRIMDKD